VFSRLYGVLHPDEKIDKLLETVEISGLKNIPTRRLSSGQITRVCLCKALLNDPGILFLDEPTASLDPDMADKTRKLLKRINGERRISILYTSHNMKEMEEMSDRLVFLDRGRILEIGGPGEIKEKYRKESLEEVFLMIARRKGFGA
ncbi:MAG: ATP-binding cassette domain-containing protein, partial [Deltaproteobacteria bacterium]|nr:ATP-binding cassette domain-containing protein [Deltaproteobacteria bacterium]